MEDIELAKFENQPFMIVELYTEKNRKHPIRRVPINMEKEKILCEFVLKYSILQSKEHGRLSALF